MLMPESYVGSALAVVAATIVLAMLRRQRAPKHPPYPPGPKGYPIIGNVFDFPKGRLCVGLAEMSKEYSEWRAFLGSHARGGCLTWIGRRFGHITHEAANG